MFSRIEVFVYVIPFQFYLILFFLKIFLKVLYHIVTLFYLAFSPDVVGLLHPQVTVQTHHVHQGSR